MKKNLLTILLSFCAFALFAQATKFSLVEHYTNSRCPSCGANNPGFYTKALPYFNKNVNHVSYHPSFPYSSCELYKANTVENEARANYNGAQSTPTYILNGKGGLKSVASMTTAILDAEKAAKSPIEVKVKEISGVAGWTANIKIKGYGTLTGTNYVLMAALCEKTLNYNAPNGEKVHHDVFRKMLTSVTGNNILAMPTVGTEAEINLNYTLNPNWNANEMYVLAWVVDPTTKEVINSGSKFTTVVGTEDLIEDENLTIYPNPTASILNLDVSKINTEATSYQIFNNIGQLLLQRDINNELMNINISELIDNQYIIKISTKEGAIVRTFVKSN
jgi:hypothetical protein